MTKLDEARARTDVVFDGDPDVIDTEMASLGFAEGELTTAAHEEVRSMCEALGLAMDDMTMVALVSLWCAGVVTGTLYGIDRAATNGHDRYETEGPE